MKVRYVLVCSLFFICVRNAGAQDTLQTTSKYLEDQFYAGITYNLLLGLPENVSQNNFSNGLQLGYIRDIPLNERRNTGLGIGLGYAVNSYFTNLRAMESGSGITYEIIPDSEPYRRNKIEMHLIEVPLEFRWRTSTATDYKFWRIYGGIKLGYAFANISKFIEDQQKDKFLNPDVQSLQYGFYISFGYNTWNFHANYQVSPVFKERVTTATGEALTMNALRVGLMFYIL